MNIYAQQNGLTEMFSVDVQGTEYQAAVARNGQLGAAALTAHAHGTLTETYTLWNLDQQAWPNMTDNAVGTKVAAQEYPRFVFQRWAVELFNCALRLALLCFCFCVCFCFCLSLALLLLCLALLCTVCLCVVCREKTTLGFHTRSDLHVCAPRTGSVDGVSPSDAMACWNSLTTYLVSNVIVSKALTDLLLSLRGGSYLTTFPVATVAANMSQALYNAMLLPVAVPSDVLLAQILGAFVLPFGFDIFSVGNSTTQVVNGVLWKVAAAIVPVGPAAMPDATPTDIRAALWSPGDAQQHSFRLSLQSEFGSTFDAVGDNKGMDAVVVAGEGSPGFLTKTNVGIIVGVVLTIVVVVIVIGTCWWRKHQARRADVARGVGNVNLEYHLQADMSSASELPQVPQDRPNPLYRGV
jgi:hypothetical protein